eukprot:TRINITY_DN12705_c0_g1_i1.p1 TRINITY_DN12705_c0_g1~~TRINITY_DN12705_c0_g1_i1.p1  ORF type:complete len:604 (+),score=64.79 TRINITY_DN12705_c0_g1_i1:44-1855(+)
MQPQPYNNTMSSTQHSTNSHYERRQEVTGPDGKTHVYVESSEHPPQHFTTHSPSPISHNPAQLHQTPPGFPAFGHPPMASQLLSNTIAAASNMANNAIQNLHSPPPHHFGSPSPPPSNSHTNSAESHSYERRVEYTGPDGKTHVTVERHQGEGPMQMPPIDEELKKFQDNIRARSPAAALFPPPPPNAQLLGSPTNIAAYSSPVQQHSPPRATVTPPAPATISSAGGLAHLQPSGMQRVAGVGSPASPQHIMPHVLGQQALRRHNELRELHGSPPLVWSEQLADSAQQWAEKCVHEQFLRHDPIKSDQAGEYGECVFSSGTTTPTGSEVTDSWFDERVQYTPGVGNHFSQVMWKGTRQLGIGVAVNKRGQYYVVARYRPPGNVGLPSTFPDNVPSSAVLPSGVQVGGTRTHSPAGGISYTTTVHASAAAQQQHPHQSSGSGSPHGSPPQQQQQQAVLRQSPPLSSIAASPIPPYTLSPGSMESPPRSSPPATPPQQAAVHTPATLSAAAPTLVATSSLNSAGSSPGSSNVRDWSIDQVSRWLQSISQGELVDTFVQNEVDGSTLVGLTKEDLKSELEIKRLSDRKAVWDSLNHLLGRDPASEA